ncbi:MAG TPA: hypothetical protein EYQ09_06290 [Flavobacteriales bacterium]|jgi:hypothetical protein|nr:hypothetical protein [Flavobacteriales bacterium]
MKKLIYTLIFWLLFNSIYAQEVIIIDTSENVFEKQALVILNGFGDSKKNRKIQQEFFQEKGYDLFIPEYVEKNSIDLTVSTFSSFYDKNNLDEYKEVKFLCYIIGGYVLNHHIEKNGRGKITTIIYDRSPTQERAPKVATERLPCISQILYGKVLAEFSEKNITPLSNSNGLTIGVIIENKATRLMRFFKKTSDSYGNYNYIAEEIEMNLDDFLYTYLDHDLMYKRFDVIGQEILHFLENGEFTENAKREKYNWDPFKKLKKNDINL